MAEGSVASPEADSLAAAESPAKAESAAILARDWVAYRLGAAEPVELDMGLRSNPKVDNCRRLIRRFRFPRKCRPRRRRYRRKSLPRFRQEGDFQDNRRRPSRSGSRNRWLDKDRRLNPMAACLL